jgi:hypothetical protein
MARENAPSLRGTENQLRPEDQGRDVVLPRTMDVTLKHLSILGIGEKLGDNMKDLALTAVPSLSKYHSKESEGSEKGVYLQNIAGIWNWRTHCWHSWSRERGGSLLIEGDRVNVLIQLTQSF